MLLLVLVPHTQAAVVLSNMPGTPTHGYLVGSSGGEDYMVFAVMDVPDGVWQVNSFSLVLNCLSNCNTGATVDHCWQNFTPTSFHALALLEMTPILAMYSVPK